MGDPGEFITIMSDINAIMGSKMIKLETAITKSKIRFPYNTYLDFN
jgi:hypothetical protein